MAEIRDRFWEKLPLEELNEREWEALCDGCGLCCLVKLEDEASEQIYFTNLMCSLFDDAKVHCSDYHNRHKKMPDCRAITLESLEEISWLPPSCAYRLRQHGKPLFSWHPLVSGDKNSVHTAKISVQGWTQNEREVDEYDYEDHLVPDPFFQEKRKIIIK